MAKNLQSPLHRTSLRREIHERIRAAILSGEIGHEERITETAISEQLGTSRAPVREALRELEQEGLVVSIGLRGYTVRPMTAVDVRDLSLLRMALERLAIGLAVERAPDDQLAQLAGVVERMERATGRRRRHDALDIEFHERLVAMAEHPQLLRMWTSIRDQLQLAMRAISLSFSANPEGFAESHRRVVDALQARDSAVAEGSIERHIREGMERLLHDAGEPPP